VVNELEKIMDGENEPKAEATIGESQRAAHLVEAPDSTAVRRALMRLLRKRVKKFIALAPDLRADAEPKTVHDMRVWSRRLQQAIVALFPKPRSGKARRLLRTPRRIRRALGEWRNCDVLLEIIERQQRRTRSEAKRRAWAFVRNYVRQKRSKEIARAGKKLLRHEVGDYAALARRLLDQSPEEALEIMMQRLQESVDGAWTEWQSARSRAAQTRAIDDLHAFRVATKDLRYRTELLYDVGHKQMKAQLKRLAALQDALGVWHDRQVLHRSIAEAVARPEVLLNQPQTARIFLAHLETDRGREAEDLEKVFRMATEHADREQMEHYKDEEVQQ
jgi:CHAD domain-containing protein